MGVAIKLETQLLRSAELPTVCTSWRTTTERNAHSWDADTSAVKAGPSVKSAKNVGLTLVALSAFNIEELPRRPIVFPGMEITLPSAPKLVATPDDLTVNSTADRDSLRGCFEFAGVNGYIFPQTLFGKTTITFGLSNQSRTELPPTCDMSCTGANNATRKWCTVDPNCAHLPGQRLRFRKIAAGAHYYMDRPVEINQVDVFQCIRRRMVTGTVDNTKGEENALLPNPKQDDGFLSKDSSNAATLAASLLPLLF